MFGVSPPGSDVFDFDSVLRSVGGEHDPDGTEDPQVGALLDVVPAAHPLQPVEAFQTKF